MLVWRPDMERAVDQAARVAVSLRRRAGCPKDEPPRRMSLPQILVRCVPRLVSYVKTAWYDKPFRDDFAGPNTPAVSIADIPAFTTPENVIVYTAACEEIGIASRHKPRIADLIFISAPQNKI